LTVDFTLFSAISIIAPLIVGAFFYWKLSPNFKTIFFIVFCFAIIELIASILFEKRVNNMVLYHIHTYVEFYFLAYLFNRLVKRKLLQRFIGYSSLLFFFASLLFFLRDNLFEFNTAQRYLQIVLLSIIILAYLHELYISTSKIKIRKNPFFWLSCGYLIYLFGTILLFLSQQMFVETGQTGYWVIHGIFNIFLNLVFTFVLWSGREKLS